MLVVKHDIKKIISSMPSRNLIVMCLFALEINIESSKKRVIFVPKDMSTKIQVFQNLRVNEDSKNLVQKSFFTVFFLTGNEHFL